MHPCTNCGAESPSAWGAAECCSPTLEIHLKALPLDPAELTDAEVAALHDARRLMLAALDNDED